jgi:hypothetical protein
MVLVSYQERGIQGVNLKPEFDDNCPCKHPIQTIDCKKALIFVVKWL